MEIEIADGTTVDKQRVLLIDDEHSMLLGERDVSENNYYSVISETQTPRSQSSRRTQYGHWDLHEVICGENNP